MAFGKGRASVEVRIGPLGATVLGKLTYERWKTVLLSWRRCNGSWMLVFADLLRYGRERFGDKRVDEALFQMQFDLGDSIKALAIGQIPLGLRTERLTSEHMFVLAKADLTEKERRHWAVVSDKEQLKPRELQKSIEAGKVLKQADIDRISGHNSGIATIQGLSFWFAQWKRKVGGDEGVLAWDLRQQEAWLVEVCPIVELAEKVAKSVAAAKVAP